MIKPTALVIAMIAATLGQFFGVAKSRFRSAPEGVKGRRRAAQLQPSPEMQRLVNVFGGDWTVSETFEVSEPRQAKGRQGSASFRLGPGSSLIENYQSDGSAGKLDLLALLGWDRSAHEYRILICANNDGCALRGTAQWEGDTFVNSWEEEVSGKKTAFRDSFEHISPSRFQLVSEGSANGNTIWRVVTKYERRNR